jgi:hypothetical protein
MPSLIARTYVHLSSMAKPAAADSKPDDEAAAKKKADDEAAAKKKADDEASAKNKDENADPDGDGDEDEESDNEASARPGRAAAAGRVPMAANLAFSTALSPAQAIGILASAPAEATAGGGLSAAMGHVQSPKVGPDGGGGGDDGGGLNSSGDEASRMAASILKSAGMAPKP